MIKKGDKRGIDLDDLDDFSGIFSSAMSHGATKSFKNIKHLFGFSCTDWKPKIKESKSYKKCVEDEYEEFSTYLQYISYYCTCSIITIMSTQQRTLLII